MQITASMVKELREKTQAGMMDVKRALQEAEGDMDRAADILREKGLSKAAKKADRIAAEGLVGIAISEDGKSASIIEVNSETDFVAKNQEFKDFVQGVADIALANNVASIDALREVKYLDTAENVTEKLNSLIAKIGENMNVRRVDVENATGAVVGYLHGNNRIAVLVNLESDANPAELDELGKDIAMQIAAMNPTYISKDDVDAAYIEHERGILEAQAMNEGKPAEIAKKMVEGRLRKQLQEVCLLDQVFVKDSDFTVGQVVENKAKELGKTIKVTSIKRYEVGEGIEKREENFAEEVAKQLGN